jgi:Protein kinase domain
VASTIPPQPDTVGFSSGYRISGYRLEQRIGRGGMAVVFGAHDERLDRQVALKILAPAMAQDDDFRQRFIAESRAAAAVEDPHIIPVYEAGEADGVLFIAMRLVPGGDLRTLVAERGPLAPVRAEWIVSAVASALDAAHACGLVHRDVKPANMLLDVRPGRPDHVYLTDFGVSKMSVSSGGVTGNGQFIGTVDYAAPEQILGQPVDGRADQYALGCAAFELLCGHPPYSGKQGPAAMYSHLSAPPPAATSERPELPAAVDNVFARVLAKSPADRYENCQEFAGALRAALGLKPYVPDGPAAPDQAHLELGGAGNAANRRPGLDPAAAHRSAVGVASSAGAGTDPRVTSRLTAGRGAAAPALRSRRVLAGVAMAVILLAAAAAAAVWFGRGPAPAPAARYRFAAQQYAGGQLAITQLWTLSGSGGSSLRVRMTVSNASGKAVTAQLAEPIPAEVARYRQSVTFTGAVTPLVTNPLVVWDLRLPAGGHDVVSYQVPEPLSGVSQQRLLTYVRAYIAESPQQELQVIAHPGLVKKVWISPHELPLTVGHAGRLTVRGRLYNRRLAPPADLTGAVWTTANSAVVFVSRSGRVLALSTGRAIVWVQIGSIRAQAIVVVSGTGHAGPPPAYYSQPPVQPSTSPSSSGSPSPTSPLPTSGSPSPTSPPPTSGSPTPPAPAPAARIAG